MAEVPRIVNALEEASAGYSAILCDVWGVLHNGVSHFAAAATALARARDAGIPVVLVTNSPRLNGEVAAQMDTLGVPRTSWDRIVTSGDVTRALIASGPRRVFHIGPDRDLTLYDGLDVEVVEEFEASAAVSTGLFDDETETPQDYEQMLRRLRARDLPFICANPDIAVERGDRMIWCAGALARDYARLGGRTLVAGKPHAPIYAASLDAASELAGRPLERGAVLAIGHGLLTDVKGASDNGLDVLYISGGLHAREYGSVDAPDAERLSAFLDRHGFRPVAVMPRLR
ncbi:MAG: TIGR01459 family HAD-type hydrolase [Rhizobiaceae bacterium]